MTAEPGVPDGVPPGTGPELPAPGWPGAPAAVAEGVGLPGVAEGVGLPGVAEGVDPEDGEAPPRTATRRALRTLVEWLLVAVCALTLALLLQTYLVQAFSIPSRSMEPALMVGDRVVAYKLGYRLHDINRGDVVVFRKPEETSDADHLIKRVVALGGETLELRGGRVYIDGQLLDEPYLAPAGSSFSSAPIPGCVNAPALDVCVVPEGQILVLGDNRPHSRDGRYFGPIEADTVVGRAFMKYWPPNDLGGL